MKVMSIALKISISILVFFHAVRINASDLSTEDQWKIPLHYNKEMPAELPDTLTFEYVFQLVISNNPFLKSLKWREEEAEGGLVQANLRPNPEFEFEAEEIGGDASGFSNSELTFLITQELELWGKRKARKKVALAEIDLFKLEALVATFDLFLETKARFQDLVFAQMKKDLLKQSIQLNSELVVAIKRRVDNGVALPSELLLGELGLDQVKLELQEVEVELFNAKIFLSALWNGNADEIISVTSDISSIMLPPIDKLKSYLQSSRDVIQLEQNIHLSQAELNHAINVGKPNLTISSGYKRIEADKSNTFVVGLSFPLPFFDKNQGEIKSKRAEQEAIKLEKSHAEIKNQAKLIALYHRISQLQNTREVLKNTILPKAEKAFSSLKETYQLGRIPYTIIIESQRNLIEIQSEIIDISLLIYRETNNLEQLLGVNLDLLIQE